MVYKQETKNREDKIAKGLLIMGIKENKFGYSSEALATILYNHWCWGQKKKESKCVGNWGKRPS